MLRSFVTVVVRRDLNDRTPRLAPPGLYASTRARPRATSAKRANISVVSAVVIGSNYLSRIRHIREFLVS